MDILKVDHLIYATADLEDAVDYIGKLTGVQPVFGGKHPGRGTHNALLSLGNGSYLEIIGPDHSQKDLNGPRAFGLDHLTESGLRTWAVRSENIEKTVEAARAAGYDPGPIRDGSRRRSDGELMEWRSTTRPEMNTGEVPPGDWLIPFVIDWGSTATHPSASAPAGCRLREILAFHPDQPSIRKMAAALGIDLPVEAGVDPRLTAVIETPRGLVTLG